MTYANGFDPSAQYQVCTWRGFTYGTRQYALGDVVTTREIDANTLFTLYRFRSVKRGEIAKPKPAVTDIESKLMELGKPQLRIMCQARGLDANGSEKQLRERLLSVVG